MAIRLLQQTSVAENGSYQGSSMLDHSSSDQSATKTTTEKTSGRKRHSSTSSSMCLSSPTKKHCSLSRVGEHVSSFKAGGISPAVQPGTECIVLGK